MIILGDRESLVEWVAERWIKIQGCSEVTDRKRKIVKSEREKRYKERAREGNGVRES